MKNLYLILVACLLFINKIRAQSDVIIWLDNSGSISAQEWQDMTNSVNQIIHEVLDCNPENRVAIVHYGYSNNGARIYIEDPNGDGAFTNIEIEATNYVRRDTFVGLSDKAHEALQVIGDALDGMANSFIMSPQLQLNHIASQNLVIYFFNDAYRDLAGSSVVNSAGITFNSNIAFLNYTNFKTNRNATFVVTTIAPNQGAIDANAIISSFSNTGNYTGTVENYAAEPDGNQLPRMYLNLTSFVITPGDLDIITSDLCFIGVECPFALTLTHPIDDVSFGNSDNRQAEHSIEASNIVYFGARAIYHAGDFVVLNEGFEAEFDSHFAAYIEGCTDDFEYRNRMLNINNNEIVKHLKEISIVPNPSSKLIKISTNNIKFSKITIVSMDGRLVLDKIVPSLKSLEVDIINYQNGIYMLSVITDDGKIYTQKLIKN